MERQESESITITGDRFKSVHLDHDAGTGIGEMEEEDTSMFKVKNVASFEILTESERKNAAEHYKKQYGVKPKSTRKPISGGFKTRPPSLSTSQSRLGDLSNDDTAATTQNSML
jgi:hypothetical protein